MKLNASTAHFTGSRSVAGGFTLIEVLVAMIILAVGVLGVATMQIQTYKEIQSSHNMSNAALLAGEMADRMLANEAQALLGNYDADEEPSGTPTDCSENACGESALADWDLKTWYQKVTGSLDPKGALPSGQGEIEEIGNTEVYRIIVRWDDDRSGSTGQECLAAETGGTPDADDLDCYVVNLAFAPDPND